MDERNEKISGDVKIKLPVSEKLENFWYYYKWHTIVGAFLLIVFSVLIFQFCTKEDYDVYIVYAGEKRISMSSLNGDGNSEYSGIVKALENSAKNGENVNISMQTLYILSEEELEKEKSGLSGELEKNQLEATVSDNFDTLKQYIIYGDYHLCLLSEDVFLAMDSDDEGSVFSPIGQYTSEGAYYEYINERGIYLSSLSEYSDTALSTLPEDTVICIRIPRDFGGKSEKESYAKAEEFLRALLTPGD